MHHVEPVRISERLGNTHGDRDGTFHCQQIVWLGVRNEILAFQKFHRDEGEVVLFACIKNRHDIRVIEAASSFRFAEEALLHIFNFVSIKFLRQGHRLDGNYATDLRILAQVHHAHRALAQLFLNLVTAQHRLFDGTVEDVHARVRAPAAAAQDNRLRHRLGTFALLCQIFEVRVVACHVIVDRLGFVELALTLKIQRQVIQIVHQLVVKRHLAKFVKRHVKLTLALESQTQHAIRLSGFGIGLLLARFGQDEALGHQKDMPHYQQCRRTH